MAEAVQLPSLNLANRYFCYHCDREFLLYQGELLCPECRGDFIEEVTEDPDDLDYEEDSDVEESEVNLLNMISVENLFRRMMSDSDSSRQASNESAEVERLSSIEPIETPAGGMITVQTAFDIFQAANIPSGRMRPPNLRHVGDYLFGDDIDAISTMLLNEAEIVGPAPLPKEQIKLLPLISVSKEDVDKQIQCTICMEDFAVREKAKSLPCTHFYHEKCITPWLERHATCPNCRKPVEVQTKNRRSKSCPRTEFSLRNSDQRRSSESVFSGFATSSVNPFRFL